MTLGTLHRFSWGVEKRWRKRGREKEREEGRPRARGREGEKKSERQRECACACVRERERGVSYIMSHVMTRSRESYMTLGTLHKFSWGHMYMGTLHECGAAGELWGGYD